MSLMNSITARNLYEFGDYFKKSLVLSVITVIITPIAAVSLFLLPPFAIFLALAVLGAAIALLVFEILMLIRLSRAKDSSPHPELIKTFQMMIAAIIVSVVSIIGNYIWWGLETILNIAAVVLQLIAWQSLGKYMVVYSTEAEANEGFPMIAEGIKTYITFTYISLGISVVNFITGFIVIDPLNWDIMDTITIIIMIISLIISIVIIVAQFKVANGLKLVFGNAPPITPGTQYGTPPTSSYQYGAPQPSIQPISPPSSEERYCSSCGSKLIPGAKFCTNCGETID